MSVRNTLRFGMRSSAVSTLQAQLKKLGHFDGPVTGYYGPITRGAVSSFERAKGLTRDGVADSAMRTALATAAAGGLALRRGMTSPRVKALQQNLQALGHFKGKVTGFFGPITQQAVRAFERANKLRVDGVAGQTVQTLAAKLANAVTKRTAAIKDAEADLKKLGYSVAAPDGKMDPRTRAALKAFQTKEKLPVSGKLDGATDKRLDQRADAVKPPTDEVVTDKGIPDTSDLSTAKRFALYEKYLAKFGDAQAKKDLAAGKRVILALRQDTPMTANQPFRGTYDDRIVVLWKDKNGPHVKELAANTEPNRRWAIPANQSSKPVGRLADNQTIRYHKAWNSNFGDHLQPVGNPWAQRDQDRDYKFEKGEQKFNGDWGGQAMFIHRAWSTDTGSQGCQTMEEGRFNTFWNALGGQRDFSYVLVNVSKR